MGLDYIMPVKSSAIASHIKSNQKMVSVIIFCFPLSLATNNFMGTYLLALIMIVLFKRGCVSCSQSEWYTSLYGIYFNHPYLPISATAPCLTQVFTHSCLV